MGADTPPEQRFREILEGAQDDLWVLEGQLDLPVVLPSVEGKITQGLRLHLGSRPGDGYIEVQAANPERVRESVWWSRDEPVVFNFRASVIARGLQNAMGRANSFLDQGFDRLTFLAGVPVAAISMSLLYNETQLEACRAGTRTAVDCAPRGTPTRNTQPIQNLHLWPQLLGSVSGRAKRALRWFRKALSSTDPDDRFLAFYLALECISDDILETTQKTHRCPKCHEDTGISKAHTDGIKTLISRHAGLPANTFQTLGRARAKLVHEGISSSGLSLKKTDSAQAFSAAAVLQELAAAGIATSLSVDPDSVHVVDVAPLDATVVAEFPYAEAEGPRTRWPKSIREVLAELRPPEPSA